MFWFQSYSKVIKFENNARILMKIQEKKLIAFTAKVILDLRKSEPYKFSFFKEYLRKNCIFYL